jgi:hypothetical protein
VISVVRARTVKAVINEAGNGQGWLPSRRVAHLDAGSSATRAGPPPPATPRVRRNRPVPRTGSPARSVAGRQDPALPVHHRHDHCGVGPRVVFHIALGQRRAQPAAIGEVPARTGTPSGPGASRHGHATVNSRFRCRRVDVPPCAVPPTGPPGTAARCRTRSPPGPRPADSSSRVDALAEEGDQRPLASGASCPAMAPVTISATAFRARSENARRTAPRRPEPVSGSRPAAPPGRRLGEQPGDEFRVAAPMGRPVGCGTRQCRSRQSHRHTLRPARRTVDRAVSISSRPGRPGRRRRTRSRPVTVRPDPGAVEDLDVAVVQDTDRRFWVVRAPGPGGSDPVGTGDRVFPNSAAACRSGCPRSPAPSPLPGGGRAFVHRQSPGRRYGWRTSPRTAPSRWLWAGPSQHPLSGTETGGGHRRPGLHRRDLRQRHLAELDRAAGTGSVPVPLLSRGSSVGGGGGLRFVPCCVHGNLAAENVLVDGNEVTESWTGERSTSRTPRTIWGGWRSGRTPGWWNAWSRRTHGPPGTPDANLARRARFVGEIAMLRWLLHGVAHRQRDGGDDAVHMLTELEQAVADRPW